MTGYVYRPIAVGSNGSKKHGLFTRIATVAAFAPIAAPGHTPPAPIVPLPEGPVTLPRTLPVHFERNPVNSTPSYPSRSRGPVSELSRDPLAAARQRGRVAMRSLLDAEGGSGAERWIAGALNLKSRRAVPLLRDQRRILGVPVGQGLYQYPRWQVTNKNVHRVLPRVLDALQEHDSWMQLAFLLNPNDRLEGQSPLVVLRSGAPQDLQRVLDATRLYGEQGAR